MALSLALVGGLTLGCGDSDEDGSAPELSMLTYAPMNLVTGESTAVGGEFVFYDDDADPLLVLFTVENVNGERFESEPEVIDYITDQPDGIIAFSIQMAPTIPGPYTLEIRMQDEAGNISSPAIATFEASDP